MASVPRPSLARHAQSGFTIVELLTVMVLASLLVGGALEVLNRQRATARVESLRVDLQQNARYAIDMLTRELQQAGQSLDATSEFGPVATTNGASSQADTLYVLFGEQGAVVHTLIAPGSSPNKIKIKTTCGDPVNDIVAGNMLYIASGSSRGIARAESVSLSSNGTSCSGKPATTVTGTLTVTYSVVDGQNHGGIFKGNNAGAALLKANVVAYYIDRSNPSNPRLVRATDYANGAWVGSPVADNVSDLQITLGFTNGTTAAVANSADADPENDYDDVNTVRVDLKVSARRTDKDLKKGQSYERTYTMTVTPRNQMYTRNLD
jgi:type IV pilus assembly protein PilW